VINQKSAVLRNIGFRDNYSEQCFARLWKSLSISLSYSLKPTKILKEHQNQNNQPKEQPTNHSTIITQRSTNPARRTFNLCPVVHKCCAHCTSTLLCRVSATFSPNFKLRHLMNAVVSFHVLQMVRHNLNNKS